MYITISGYSPLVLLFLLELTWISEKLLSKVLLSPWMQPWLNTQYCRSPFSHSTFVQKNHMTESQSPPYSECSDFLLGKLKDGTETDTKLK
jgi:hypothetical protein